MNLFHEKKNCAKKIVSATFNKYYLQTDWIPEMGKAFGFGSKRNGGLIFQGFFHLLHIFDYLSIWSTPNSWRKIKKYAKKRKKWQK